MPVPERSEPVRLQAHRTGRGTPVTLLHGLGLSARMWDPFAAALAAEGFEAIAVDLRGHGSSPIVDAEVDLELLTADVADFLERERVERPHLLGFSMGGMIAMRLAAAHRPLRSLTLVSTSAQPDPLRGQFEATAQDFFEHGSGPQPQGGRLPLRDGLDEAGAERFLEMLCAPGYAQAHPELRQRYAPIILGNSKVGVYRAALAVVRRPDVLGRLAVIEAPTLLLSGGLDGATPPSCSAALAAAIPAARLASFPRAGHLLTEEEPERFAQLVLGHLREHA